MSDWTGALPFVGAIIERNDDRGELELLIQTRWTPKHQSIYNGTLEFAAGKLDLAYENVYDAIIREVKEETGLTVKRFINQNSTKKFTPQKDDSAFGFMPFCCVQQLSEGRPWVGFIFRCEVEPGDPRDLEGESKDVHWVKAKEFFELFKNKPEKLFTLELPAWDYYFKEIGYLSSEA